MSGAPENFRYTQSHEWVELLDDGTVRVGITDHAQDLLGDLVYVELPPVGAAFTKGQACGVVESVKAASDIYSPVAGDVVAVNEELSDHPELINQSPHEKGWILQIKPANPAELEALLDARAYTALAESGGE